MIGDRRVPQCLYTGTCRHTHTPSSAPLAPQQGQPHYTTHKQPACTTCKCLRKSARACCALGHHAVGYVSRRPQSQLCEAHQLPPSPRCVLKQRGVWYCCSWGHHRVCTPVLTHRKRMTSAQPPGPNKKPRLSRPAQPPTISLRSPHCPPTPPAPKRRRPKSPPPPSPPRACTTQAGGDMHRGRSVTPAFHAAAWKIKVSGYITNTHQRFSFRRRGGSTAPKRHQQFERYGAAASMLHKGLPHE